MNELRLRYAEPEPVKTPADIEKALDDWRMFNSKAWRWAKFEALQFKYERVVRVTWGHRFLDGGKEIALQTISYKLNRDGSVSITKHTYS